MRSPARGVLTPFGRFDWAVASRAHPGEATSGDMSLVTPRPNGTLVAVVDALGHGSEAAATAQLAIATLQVNATLPLPALLRECHEVLRPTRGVVLALAEFDERDHTMTWIGVGNVAGVMLFADPAAQPDRTALVSLGGIVGLRLPPSRPWVIPVADGDMLLLATDGVLPGFPNGLGAGATPRQLADHVLERYAKTTDDALVLAAHYRPDASAESVP